MGAFQSAVNSAISSVSHIAGINKLIEKRTKTTKAPAGAPLQGSTTQQNKKNKKNIAQASAQSQARKIATQSSSNAVEGKRVQKKELSKRLSPSIPSTDEKRPSKTNKSVLSQADITAMVKELLNG